MGKLISLYASHIKDLTFTEKQVLYFIEDNLDRAQTMSLTALAEENNVSTTTIIRLSHKLGYSGFAELKFNLKRLYTEFNASEDANELDPVHQYMEQLATGLNQLDVELIKEAADLMKHSKKVVIVSVGLTKMVGEYMSKRLMQLNCSSSYIYESHMIDLITNWVTEEDCIIFISSSGNTETILKAVEKMDHQGIPTIALTNNPDSSLMKSSEIGISLSVQNQLYGGYDISARSFLVVLCDLIIDYYHLLNDKEAQ
ncbi:MurR/RpiR family transcriptional regulator [Alkalibacterium sp.]